MFILKIINQKPKYSICISKYCIYKIPALESALHLILNPFLLEFVRSLFSILNNPEMLAI